MGGGGGALCPSPPPPPKKKGHQPPLFRGKFGRIHWWFPSTIKAPVFGALNSAISNFQTWFVRTVMEVLKYCWMKETSNIQCNYNHSSISFHVLFRNAVRCRKTGACRILVSLRYATWDGESDDKNCLFSAEAERNFQEEAARKKEKEKQEKEKAKQAEAAKAESTRPKKTVTEIAKGNNAEPSPFNSIHLKLVKDFYLITDCGVFKLLFTYLHNFSPVCIHKEYIIVCPADWCECVENWQCERFACSRQKGVNDKTPTIKKIINPTSIINKLAGYDIWRQNLAWYEISTNKTCKW